MEENYEFDYKPNQYLLGLLKESDQKLEYSLLSLADELINKSGVTSRIKNFFGEPISFKKGKRIWSIYLFQFIEISFDTKGESVFFELYENKEINFFSSYNNLEDIIFIYKKLAEVSTLFVKSLTDDFVDLIITSGAMRLEEHKCFYEDCLQLDPNLLISMEEEFKLDIYLPSLGMLFVTAEAIDDVTPFGELYCLGNSPKFREIYTDIYKENNVEELRKAINNFKLEDIFLKEQELVNRYSKDYDFIDPSDNLDEELSFAIAIHKGKEITCLRTINNVYYVFERYEYKGYRFESIDNLNAALRKNNWLDKTFVS